MAAAVGLHALFATPLEVAAVNVRGRLVLAHSGEPARVSSGLRMFISSGRDGRGRLNTTMPYT